VNLGQALSGIVSDLARKRSQIHMKENIFIHPAIAMNSFYISTTHRFVDQGNLLPPVCHCVVEGEPAQPIGARFSHDLHALHDSGDVLVFEHAVQWDHQI
jgi:hypothetical protein